MKKKVIKIIIVVIAVLGLTYVWILNKSGQFKTIENKISGKMEVIYHNVPGPEDMQADYTTNKLFIAACSRRPENLHPERNGIYMLDAQSMEPPRKLVDDYSGTLVPHGMSLWREDSLLYIFVVNHSKKGEFIERFLYNGTDTLKHLNSYEMKGLCCINDVAATGPNTFYATNDHATLTGFSRFMEDFFGFYKGSVVYYEDNKLTTLAEGIGYPNGLYYDKNRSKLYVGTSTEKSLVTFNVEPDKTLKQTDEVYLGSALDNVDLDLEGNLWTGTHPKMLDFAKYFADSTHHSPSMVFKLTPDNGSFKAEEAYVNDGSELSGSTIAVHIGDELFIGGVFDYKLLRIKLQE